MTQKQVLEHLQEHEEATVKEIVQNKDLSKRSANSNLESLRKTGYVEKNGTDKNNAYIHRITEKGKDVDPESLQGMVV